MKNEKRLVYAQEVKEIFDYEVYSGATDLFDAFDSAIENATTVDAVEVVRCKECHWWRKINAKNGCGICRHEVFSVDDCTVDPVTEPDDFCSYGERKEA